MKRFYYYTPIVLQKVGFLVFWSLYRLFLRIEVRGKENLKDLPRPVILAANHTSELDVTARPIMLGLFSYLYPIYYVSNPKERYKDFGWRKYIYGGIFFNWLGGYSIYPGRKNYAFSLQNHLKLLAKNRTILIFPEGKRTPDGKIGRARGGLGYMTFYSSATVVPIAINTFYNLSWKEFFSRKRKVIITILPSIDSKDLFTTNNPKVGDFQNASRIVLEKIEKTFEL